jgi:hypothetical protein
MDDGVGEVPTLPVPKVVGETGRECWVRGPEVSVTLPKLDAQSATICCTRRTCVARTRYRMYFN